MHRLFVAIRPPAAVRATLRSLMEGVAGARWQDDAQLHLTLRFIGEVDRHRADDVAAALTGVRQPRFRIALAGLGKFERRGRLDALWAGVAPRDALDHLHRKVDQALVRAGLPPEGRAYLPHITLARFGRGAGSADAFLARHGGLAGPPFEVEHFCLFESHLSHAGSVYETVERYRLD